MINATPPEPYRNLNAGFHERTTGSRVEFAKWREDNPKWTSKELLIHWKRIRIAWGVSEPEPKRVTKTRVKK